MKMVKVGADLRAATRPNREVAAQGDSGHRRCFHFEEWHFQETFCADNRSRRSLLALNHACSLILLTWDWHDSM